MAKKIYRNKEVEQEAFPSLMSMDDVEDGTIYGKLNRNYVDKDGNLIVKSITAEWALITGSGKPADNADVTGDNAQAYAWLTGSKPPVDADNTASNAQAYAWITGSKPPANADYTQAVLDAGASILHAKVSGSTLIYNGYIRSDFITATNIVTGTLTGVRIRTAASGQRVDMTSNKMYFYSSSGLCGNIYGAYLGGYNIINFTSRIHCDDNIHLNNGKNIEWSFNSKIQCNGSKFYVNKSWQPYSSNNFDLGVSSAKWRHLYLDQNLYMDSGQNIYWNSTNYLTHDGNVFKINDDLQPVGDKRLGYTDKKWHTVHRVNEQGCHLPTSNCALDTIRKLKKPKIESGKDFHYGSRHYFKTEDFPDEMKIVDEGSKRADKKEIELTRVQGVTLNAVRELVEKFDNIDNRLKTLEK